MSAPSLEPGLYIVATPIGNLRDITLRALEVLAGCDLIACEDTRVTGKLLKAYAIDTRMISYHEHNADTAGNKILDAVQGGKSIALVSDAGTPLVSDPGFRLVYAAQELQLPVWPIPGASAPVTALAASGMPNETWTFGGFLPTKEGARKSHLHSLVKAPGTLVFFESPNRLAKSLSDMVEIFGPERRACVARELTKLHEEITRDTLSGLHNKYAGKTVKGEIVVLVAPEENETAIDTNTLLKELLEKMSVSKAAGEAAQLTGLSKRDLYQQALAIKDGKE